MVAALVGRSFPFLSIRADSIDVHTTHRERERAKPPKDTRDRKKKEEETRSGGGRLYSMSTASYSFASTEFSVVHSILLLPRRLWPS